MSPQRYKHKTLRIYAIANTESCKAKLKRFNEEPDAVDSEITVYCWARPQLPLSFQGDQQKISQSLLQLKLEPGLQQLRCMPCLAFVVLRVLIGRCDLSIIHQPIMIYLPWNVQSRAELNFCTRHDSEFRSCELAGPTRQALIPRPRYKDRRLEHGMN